MTITLQHLTLIVLSFHIDNRAIRGKELIHYLLSRRDITARVTTHVDNEVLETCLRQSCQRHQHFSIGILAEVAYLDIAGIVVEHMGSRNTSGLDFLTGNGKVFHRLLMMAHNTDLHLGALRSLQVMNSCLISDTVACKRLVVG